MNILEDRLRRAIKRHLLGGRNRNYRLTISANGMEPFEADIPGKDYREAKRAVIDYCL